MKRRTFLINMLLLALISGAAFTYSLYFLDPRDGWINITIFLVSLFFLTVGLFSFTNFTFIRKKSNNESHFSASKGSLRRGLLLGLYAVAVLGLSALELLTWWDSLLLAFSLVLFELYFISGKEEKS